MTRRCRHGLVGASTRTHRTSTVNASGSSRTASFPTDLVTRNRRVAEAALRPWTPVFTHGDLQIAHVFVDGDEITGVIDWSEAGPGHALYDLASLTLGHEEHLGDVVDSYGTDVGLDVIRACWSLRSLRAVRWLVEHGFDPSSPGCEVDVLRSRMGERTQPR
jgi:aminoglycoside phosphotransferase (APT) family kinase protein